MVADKLYKLKEPPKDDAGYIELLFSILEDVVPMLNDVTNWESLIINRREPHTFRAFHTFHMHHSYRLCLHRFDACDEDAAFMHPHGWPMAALLLEGTYWMNVGKSVDNSQYPEHLLRLWMRPGTAYAMTEPLLWHSVVPLEPCYTIMLNGPPYSEHRQHQQVRTTKGKDLDKMPPDELKMHLQKFKRLIQQFL